MLKVSSAKEIGRAAPPHRLQPAPNTSVCDVHIQIQKNNINNLVFGSRIEEGVQHKGMGHAVGDKLVYCHEALHLKKKLQTASYEQKGEKWDTDSDSDKADDEKDLAV